VVRALAVAGRGASPGVLDVEIAEPGPGEVRVRVEAASLNGFDLAVAAGRLWDVLPHRFPVTLGRDYAGTVEAVGAGVTGLAVGERVAGVNTSMRLGAGALAEAVVADASTLAHVPDGVDTAAAAAAGLAGLTAIALVDAVRLTRADVVLVAGSTGGVGAIATQLAAARGATVIGTARSEEGAAFVERLGAEQVVDHTSDLAASVEKAAPGGVTAVVHSAGDLPTVAGLLPPGGRLASALGATVDTTGRTDITVAAVSATAAADILRDLLDRIAAGTLRVPVQQVYDLLDSPAALAAFAAPKLGKIVVRTAR
jgi:NADPH:quinone reductase-like Zn-dependent oxidoreductase